MFGHLVTGLSRQTIVAALGALFVIAALAAGALLGSFAPDVPAGATTVKFDAPASCLVCIDGTQGGVGRGPSPLDLSQPMTSTGRVGE